MFFTVDNVVSDYGVFQHHTDGEGSHKTLKVICDHKNIAEVIARLLNLDTDAQRQGAGITNSDVILTVFPDNHEFMFYNCDGGNFWTAPYGKKGDDEHEKDSN